MQRERRDDRIQGVLFSARPTVFAGSPFHPKALLLTARHVARRLTKAAKTPAAPKITTQYHLASAPSELLKRFK